MLGRNGFKVNKLVAALDKPVEHYFCTVYLCNKKSVDKTGNCEEHKSPLRTGLPLFSQGSAPIIRKGLIK